MKRSTSGFLLLLPCICSALASVNNVTPVNTNAKPSSGPSIQQQQQQQRSSIPRSRETPIPITVLAGFLGSGKTTLLQNLLNNNEGLRIAVVVNDVASVNIDSKLVSSMNSAAGMVELQNGCACCSKSEELLSSVADLVTLSDMRAEDQGFDHIVVEMSGVADPVSVRSKFQEAAFYNMPLLDRVRLDTMVTLVDCSTFTDYLQSSKNANPDEAPELFFRKGEEQEQQQLPDEFDGISTSLLAKLGIGMARDSDSGVAELIVSQTETADIVLLNKVDLVVSDDNGEAVLAEIEDIVAALNPRARVVRTKFGNIPLGSVLGVAQGQGVVLAGVIDDHKDAVMHAAGSSSIISSHATPSSHDHGSHEHDADTKNTAATTHSHAHNEPDASADDVTSHSHAHVDHLHSAACDDPDCSDVSHSHHTHEHDVDACGDPDCADPSHSHSSSSSSSHAGIGAFVYRARRPFHPGRLLSFLRYLPLKRGLPKEIDGEASPIALSASAKQVMGRVLRSKGFAWCANSDVAALYWSHAGTSFELSCLGSWWATLPREQWPPEAVSSILQDFDSVGHNEDDAGYISVGDRRQEIVFIGSTLGDNSCQTELSRTLDQCLVNDDEWSEYVKSRSNEVALADVFPSTIEAKQLSY